MGTLIADLVPTELVPEARGHSVLLSNHCDGNDAVQDRTNGVGDVSLHFAGLIMSK